MLLYIINIQPSGNLTSKLKQFQVDVASKTTHSRRWRYQLRCWFTLAPQWVWFYISLQFFWQVIFFFAFSCDPYLFFSPLPSFWHAKTGKTSGDFSLYFQAAPWPEFCSNWKLYLPRCGRRSTACTGPSTFLKVHFSNPVIYLLHICIVFHILSGFVFIYVGKQKEKSP